MGASVTTGCAQGGGLVMVGERTETCTSHQHLSAQAEISARLHTPPCGQKAPLHGNQGGEVALKAPLKSLRKEKSHLTEKTHFPLSALVR